MTKQQGQPPKTPWWPDIEEVLPGTQSGEGFYPEVRETGLAPVSEPWATFPWPKGYEVVVTKRMARR